MIAFLSASIEMAVRSFANALLAIFPFLPASLATNPEQIMIIIGFAGQGLFAMRFIVQWLTSEGQGRSVIPIAFWYFSIGGGAVLLLYAIWRQDPGDHLRTGAWPIYLSSQSVFDPKIAKQCRQR
jgi:lipid-A-disaccharide synthase-like uncharacterized protein